MTEHLDIILPLELKTRAEILAREEGVSLEELVRESLHNGPENMPNTQRDPFFDDYEIFAGDALSTLSTKFCDAVVTPSPFEFLRAGCEGSRLSFSIRGVSKGRDSSTPSFIPERGLRGVYPMARCRAQNDIPYFLLNGALSGLTENRDDLYGNDH